MSRKLLLASVLALVAVLFVLAILFRSVLGGKEAALVRPAESTTTVMIYLEHGTSTASDCGAVVPVPRVVSREPALGVSAIKALLAGPTQDEVAQGYFTSIPASGVALRSLAVNGGTASVDFNEGLEAGVAGSCRVTAIRAEITRTLEDISGVNDVVISINGRTQDILQP